MNPSEIEKDTWKVIYNYFDTTKHYLTKHHQDSYNDFILNKIPQTFKQYNPQILYKNLDKRTKKYDYEMHIYYGGKNADNIYLSKPIIYKEDENGGPQQKQLYPNEARLRNLTYGSHIFCDITIDYIIRTNNTENTITKTYNKINIGKIPIMLQSKLCILHDMNFETRRQAGECPYDQGGYFIIDGLEKVIVSHERKAENKLYIVSSNEGLHTYSAQIKSVPEDSFKYARTTVVNILRNDESISIRLPMLNKPVPLFIMFRLLGIETDKEILKYILYEFDSEKSKLFIEKLKPSIENNGLIYNQINAIKFLSNYSSGKTTSHLLDIISTDLFPHIGNDYRDKAYYLGYVVNRLLHVSIGLDNETDRDSFIYKRVDLSGFLLANLFRENFKQFQRDAKIAIDSEYRFNTSQYQDNNYADIINPSNIKKIFNNQVIENSFNKAFKIGTILNKKGLVQTFNRLSSVGAISHLRRINTISDMVMIGQRKLHGTQYGIICPVETPDGGNIGIKKHLSIMGHITFGCDSKPIIKLLYEYNTKKLTEITPDQVKDACKIIINGRWIGIHNKPDELLNILKTLRRNGLINIFTSISWNIQHNEISILTDNGRCCRPLYIVEDNKLLLTKDILDKVDNKSINWEQLVTGFKDKNTKFDYYNCEYLCPTNENFNKSNLMEDLKQNRGICEYLDVDEINTCLLSKSFDLSDQFNKYTHCEIHPCLIMGALGFTIPFANQSQAPRNVYGTGQTKQSVGLYISNFRKRFDKSAHVLYNPQRPLISTKLSDKVFVNKLPTGINAIVAIACYTGYNQEDSIILNKSSLERGLFRSCYFKTYESVEMNDTKNNMEEGFFNPNITNLDINLKKENNFSKLDDNGFIKEGIFVEDDDVLIGKYSKIGSGAYANYVDSSEVIKKDGYGVVDKVFSDYYNTNNQRMCKVRICTDRMPQLGDKFASRHGQKGVIGMLLPQEDMPFSKDGIVPDMIINPHAIPSRMTLGQFIECVMGKACSVLGCTSDGTPFTNIDYTEMCDILQDKCGFDNYGDEVLYSGILGTQLQTKIFIGPTYYQRLKHMVKDKVNSRAQGKMTLKNHQPPSGRSAGGGLRIGEMERDAIISHGAFQFLKESVMDRSDKYEYYISENTGLQAIANTKKNKYICPSTSGPLKFSGDTNEDLRLNMNNEKANIVKVSIPYNVKMMIQECEAMGMALRLIPNPEPEHEKINLKEYKFKPQAKDSFKVKNKFKTNINFSKLNTSKIFLLGSKVKVKKGPYQNDEGIIDSKISDSEYSVEITKSDTKSHEKQKRTFNTNNLETIFDVIPASEYQSMYNFTTPSFMAPIQVYDPKQQANSSDSPGYMADTPEYGKTGKHEFFPPSSGTYNPPSPQGYMANTPKYDKTGNDKFFPPSSGTYNPSSPQGYMADTPEYGKTEGVFQFPTTTEQKSESPDYGPPREGETEEEYEKRTKFTFPTATQVEPEAPNYSPPKDSNNQEQSEKEQKEDTDVESSNEKVKTQYPGFIKGDTLNYEN